MGIFRKQALEALSTPEKLDQPIKLIRTSYWILLVSLFSFLSYITLWAFLGKLPLRVYGKGVILSDNKDLNVVSQVAGQIKEIIYRERDCISKGDVLFRIDPHVNKSKLAKLNSILDLTKKEDLAQKKLSNKLINIEIETYERFNKLFKLGAISKNELNEREIILTKLNNNNRLQESERNLKIKNLEAEIINIKKIINEKSIYKIPQDACIIDKYVDEEDFVQAGSLIYKLSINNKRNQLISYAYFPVNDGKRLRVGQEVKIIPTTTKPQRHGGIKGYITSIREDLVSKELLLSRLDNKSLVEYVQFRSKAMGTEIPLIEITTSLEKDINTITGYDWGGGKGPNLNITKGTTTKINVIAEERKPIEYVIPILRNLTGIY